MSQESRQNSIRQTKQLLREAINELDRIAEDELFKTLTLVHQKIGALTNDLNNVIQEITGYTFLMQNNLYEPDKIDGYRIKINLAVEKALSISGQLRKLSTNSLPLVQPAETPPPIQVQPEIKPAGLPAQTPRARPTPEDDPNLMVFNSAAQKPTILIVDDQREVAEIAMLFLTSAGYRVILAGDGVEALEVFRSHRSEIKLVIMDYNMPRLNGELTYYGMREINPDIDVFFSSGVDDRDKMDWLIKQGAVGCIPKPYTKEHLLRCVKSVLGV